MFIPCGFKAASVHAGFRGLSTRHDLCVWFSPVRCSAAGVFTKNRVSAAPVEISKKHIRSGYAHALVVNTGCANAATGVRGLKDGYTVAKTVGQLLAVDPYDVLMASTGVIGVPLNMTFMKNGLAALAGKLVSDEVHTNDFIYAAQAIMTTDTFPKITSRRFTVSGRPVHMWGCAKGAGMIHPSMATMLSFFLTDAAIAPRHVRNLLKKSVDTTFNRISVDGDTSTNDTVFLLANGCSGTPELKPGSSGWHMFSRLLHDMSGELAQMIAGDGEGAQHAITLCIEKAPNIRAAEKIARTVATSPLVKTALNGRDPNWGRILAAVGRSGVAVDPAMIDIYIGPHCVCRHGKAGRYSLPVVRQTLGRKEIIIRIVLHKGVHAITFWTCDLSEKYIQINAHYTT